MGDLKQLIHHFAGPDWRLDPDVIPVLEQNAIDRAKILADDDRIRAQNLPPEVVNGSSKHPQWDTNDEIDLFTYTRQHVLEMYEAHHSNKSETARALGISRRTLYRLFEKYGSPAACAH